MTNISINLMTFVE